MSEKLITDVCSECGQPLDKAPVLEFGPIRMDRRTQQLWLDGVEHHLPRSEFILLWSIVRRRGKITPYWWIANELNYEGDSPTYVYDLMKKTRREIGGAVVKTVYGEGYRIA